MQGKATKTPSPSPFSSMVGHEGAGSIQCPALALPVFLMM